MHRHARALPFLRVVSASTGRSTGGLELPAKMVQERLGHANIAMTLDTYGHLFPRDDGRELAEAELRLIG